MSWSILWSTGVQTCAIPGGPTCGHLVDHPGTLYIPSVGLLDGKPGCPPICPLVGLLVSAQGGPPCWDTGVPKVG